MCQRASFSVIPAEAGIQDFIAVLDSRLRGNDKDGRAAVVEKTNPIYSYCVLRHAYCGKEKCETKPIYFVWRGRVLRSAERKFAKQTQFDWGQNSDMFSNYRILWRFGRVASQGKQTQFKACPIRQAQSLP